MQRLWCIARLRKTYHGFLDDEVADAASNEVVDIGAADTCLEVSDDDDSDNKQAGEPVFFTAIMASSG